tara:strand:+ start:323 stop:634 length:312 start_codon:yes stop_codon:yes gene_type:complete
MPCCTISQFYDKAIGITRSRIREMDTPNDAIEKSWLNLEKFTPGECSRVISVCEHHSRVLLCFVESLLCMTDLVVTSALIGTVESLFFDKRVKELEGCVTEWS